MSYNEKAVERTGYNGGAGKSFEGRGGCKTTCNRTRETDNLSSFDKEHHSTRERVSPRISIQHHENTLDRRGKGITPANGDNHSKDLSMISSSHFCAETLKDVASQSRAQLGKTNWISFCCRYTYQKAEAQIWLKSSW